MAAAAGIAVSYWHLNISRLGFRTMMLPLVSALAIAFFWRGWTTARTREHVWSGIWFAISFYTYLAARLLPVVVVLFVLSELGLDVLRLRHEKPILWERWRPRLKGLTVMALVAFQLAAPLLWVFWANPELVSARTDEISVFTAPAAYMSGTPLQRVLHNIVTVAGSFYIGGDWNVRHNLPNRPVNDPLVAILFTAGWLVALVRIEAPHTRLILFWLLVMLVPVVLSIEAPHNLRGTGALPAIALLYGLGTYGLVLAIVWLSHQLPNRHRSRRSDAAIPTSGGDKRLATIAGLALLASLCVFSGTQTANDYFVKWARLPVLGKAFNLEVQLAAAGVAKLTADPTHPAIVLSRNIYNTPQMGYALGNVPEADVPEVFASPDASRPPVYRLVEEASSYASKSSYVIWSEAGHLTSAWVEVLENSQGEEEVQSASNDRPSVLLSAPYGHAGSPQLRFDPMPETTTLQPRAPDHPLNTYFANGMTLAGYSVGSDSVTPGAGQVLELFLFWRPTALANAGPERRTHPGIDSPYDAFDVFAHLENKEGVWDTHNGLIDSGYLLNWSPSAVVIEDVRVFTPPSAVPSGKAFFEVGLYRYDPARQGSEQDRIPILNDQGQEVADSATLGGIWIGAEPAPADFSDLTPLGVQFDNQVEVVGWRMQPDPINPSQLQVILGWRALDRPASDYTAFVHLIDQNGTILTQYDQPPAGADNPSHLWVPGETTRTVFPLPLPAASTDAQTSLRIGLYEPVSGRQLLISGTQAGTPGAIDDSYVVIPAHLPELSTGDSSRSSE